jgi:hypothetical protein
MARSVLKKSGGEAKRGLKRTWSNGSWVDKQCPGTLRALDLHHFWRSATGEHAIVARDSFGRPKYSAEVDVHGISYGALNIACAAFR